MNLERALDSLRIVGVDAGRGSRIHGGEPRVHCRPAQTLRVGIECARESARCASRQRRDAADQRRAGTASCRPPAAAPARASMSAMASRSVAHELPRRIDFRRRRPGRAGDGGTAARVAASGLALPMSRPRYTCAESTLTISMGNSRASRSAKSLLPVPVGPVSTAIGLAWRRASIAAVRGRSSPAQEHAVELLQADLRPGRPAVIALVGARRLLHLAQQRIHLRQREPPMRVDGRTAGDGA